MELISPERSDEGGEMMAFFRQRDLPEATISIQLAKVLGKARVSSTLGIG